MDARIFEPDCLSAPSCIDKRDDVADGDEATDDVFEPVFCERKRPPKTLRRYTRRPVWSRKAACIPAKNASTHGHAVLEVTRIAPMRISARTGESP